MPDFSKILEQLLESLAKVPEYDFKKMFGFIYTEDHEDFMRYAPTIFKKQIKWEKNENQKDYRLFKAKVDDKLLELRVNDFPDEPLYTLMVDNKPTITFDDPPHKTWSGLPKWEESKEEGKEKEEDDDIDENDYKNEKNWV